MARQKQRSQLNAIDEINMTPLIDLTFLLLIIFMITAPLLEYGVNVSPPEMNAETIKDEDSKVINLDHDGNISFDGKVVAAETLASELTALASMGKKVTVLVRADGDRPYREVMTLMKIAKNSGIKDISLITQAEE